MDYLEMLKKLLEKNKKMLEELQQDEESKKINKKQIAQIKKEIKSIEGSIKRQEEQKIRESKVNELEKNIPSEIKNSMQYRFVIDGYIMQNSSPNVGDITVDENGKVTFKYGGLPEIDDGKLVMQLKDDAIYTYEDRKAYEDNAEENLTNLIISVKKNNLYTGIGEKFSVTAMNRGGQWSYQENDLYYWKDIEDISKLPIEELLSLYSVSGDLQKFLNDNFIPVPQKEKTQEKISTKQQEQPIITKDNVLTVDDLKKEYTYVFDNDNGIVRARKVEKQQVSNYLFFKDESGIVTFIPELSHQVEGDNNGKHYRSSSSSSYGTTRSGSHTFDVHEWGFDVNDDEDLEQINKYEKPYRYDKHYRFVTLDESKRLIKVFESENYIDKPWANLYHRNKDENGKQCIRLVDLAGNVHSIKEGGKAGEKGLKEKTYGPRGDYQLKVVYKDKEPVYALFMGEVFGNKQNEFCTAEELRECFERYEKEFQRRGIYMNEDSCFMYMEEIIENFNETFMQGNFIPTQNKINTQEDEKSVTELAEELMELNETEQKAKQLLEQYEKQLPNKEKEVEEE